MNRNTKAIQCLGAVAVMAIALVFPGPAGATVERFKVPGTKAELEAVVKGQAAAVNGRLGVYIRHIESGQTIALRENEPFQLASVFKVPLLATLYKQISLGRISLDDRINFTESMKTFGSGLMIGMKPGLNISVNDMAILMMARSDNTATDILFQMAGGSEAINSYMAELGLKDTHIDYDTRGLILAFLGLDPARRLTIAELNQLPTSVWDDPARLERSKAFDRSLHNTSTPKEIGTLLEKFVKGEIVDKASSTAIIDTMRQHTGADLIIRYLPEGVGVARKGGSLSRDGADTVLLDAAIIELPNGKGTLVVCVFGNDLKEVHYEIKDKVGRISRAAYDYFTTAK